MWTYQVSISEMREFAQLQELQFAQSLHVLMELLYIKSGPRSNETLRIECDVFYNPAVALCFSFLY